MLSAGVEVGWFPVVLGLSALQQVNLQLTIEYRLHQGPVTFACKHGRCNPSTATGKMANPIPKTASGLSITAQSRGLGAQGNTSSSALSPRSPFLLRTAQEITGDREPSQFARSELSKSVQSTGPAQKDQLRKHNLQAEERVEPQRQNLESVVKRNRSNTTSNAIAPVNLRATALSRSNSFHQGGASALSTKSNKISTPEEVVRKILSERGVLGATDPALWAVQNFTDYPAYETLRTALFAALVDQPEYPLILPPELVQMLTDEALSNDDRQK